MVARPKSGGWWWCGSLGGVWYGEGAARGGERDDMGEDGTGTANDDGGENFVPC